MSERSLESLPLSRSFFPHPFPKPLPNDPHCTLWNSCPESRDSTTSSVSAKKFPLLLAFRSRYSSPYGDPSFSPFHLPLDLSPQRYLKITLLPHNGEESWLKDPTFSHGRCCGSGHCCGASSILRFLTYPSPCHYSPLPSLVTFTHS